MLIWGLDPMAERPERAEDMSMNVERQHRVSQLRKLVAAGEYCVDPDAVADAVMRCLNTLDAARGDAPALSSTPHSRGRVRAGARALPTRPRAPQKELVAVGG